MRSTRRRPPTKPPQHARTRFRINRCNSNATPPYKRSTLPNDGAFPALPREETCFRIDTFALDVSPTLPDAIRERGASALPLDRFAFAREWLDHYGWQCVGKQGIATLSKGLQQTILSRGYVTTRVLVPEQDIARGYYQQIAGAKQTFVSSGNSQTAGFKLARVLHRSQNDVFGGYVQLS